MAVTTKKLFPATSNATTTVFNNVGIQLNNQDDLDVYVTLSGGTRVLQLRQSTGSTAQSSHPQVNNTDGLYFPAVSAGTTLYNYQLSTDNNTITFNSALPQGAVVFCERRTRDADSSYTSFASGSTIRATDLNNSSTESNFTAQDGRNKALTIEGVLFRGDQPSTNFITTDHIVNGSIITTDIANDSVTADKIPDDTINSEHYVDLSIDTQHIANENITTAKLDNDAVTASKLADNAVVTDNIVNSNVTTAKIADANVTRVKLEADIIDGTKLADNAVDSEHYTDGSIDRVHLEADIIDSTKLADNAVNSEHYVDGSIDHVHLANDIIDGDNIQDDVINSEHIAAGALDNEHYATGSITSNKLSGDTVITSSEQGSATTNDTSFLTSAAADARFFNISSGDTIKDGQTFPDNDTTIATTAAINDRIIDLVDDVGGFVPIANETSFPATNPDVNNGAGTIVSVSALSSAITTGSGVTTATIANGAGTGNTVTITGLTASTTYPAGFGFLVETTTTTHTYTFHRLLPKATEVETVAGSIGSVNTCATNIADINTVAADLNEGTSEIETVANSITNVNTVGNAIANVNTTATNIANVNTTASNITNVNNVGNNISNVNSVHGNASNINSAVSNASNINTVAGSISNVNTVGNAIANVNTTAGSITNVNTVASNVTDVNNFADLYQISSSNPSTDGGGNSLAEGDLYFNTSANRLKVYDGANWVDGVIASGGGAQTTGDTFTGDVKFNDNVKALFGTGSDLEIFHNGNHSKIINKTGNLTLNSDATTGAVDIIGSTGQVRLLYGGAEKLASLSSGVDVTGNITVSGNVDGRDVSADGTKLDGIESGSTADQTASEIVALVADQTIAPSEIDMEDNEKIKLGTGDDLEIYHNGSNSRIENSTGYLLIDSTGGDNVIRSTNDVYLQPANGEFAVKAIANGAVELYHNNSKKFETTSGGADVTGRLTTDGVHIGDGGNNDTSLSIGASNDLRLYHDGSNSYIRDRGTGSLSISGSQVSLDSSDLSEYMIKAVENAQVELYHNGSKKFETTSTGTTITGDLFLDNPDHAGSDLLFDSSLKKLQFNDGVAAKFGTGSDLSIYHNGSTSFISQGGTGQLIIQGNDNDQVKIMKGSSEEGIILNNNGDVELYHNNSKKLETTSNGVNVTGELRPTADLIMNSADNQIIYLGAGNDLQIYHNGSHSFISDQGTGRLKLLTSYFNVRNDADNENIIEGISNGAVNLYYDGNIKFYTYSEGVGVAGNLNLGDSSSAATGRLRCGNGADLQIYHNQSFNIIDSANDFDLKIMNGSETMAVFDTNGGVELYHNNNKKFETTSTGATLTGTLLGNGLSFNTLVMNSDTQDSINFTATSTNDKRGIAFNDRTALSADYNDGYLRLNEGSEFSNGVYTPSVMRADGGFNVGGTTLINSSGQIIASRLTGALPPIDGSALTGVNPTIANDCIYENEDVISSTVSTTSGKNAMSAGPIQITGTLTVADNTTYTIV